MNPPFNLIKSLYYFNDFDIQVKNFLVEYTDYDSYTNAAFGETDTSKEIDTLINSFIMNIPDDLTDHSDKNLIHYKGKDREKYKYGYAKYEVKLTIDESNGLAKDIYLSCYDFYSPYGIAHIEEDFTIEIEEAEIDYLSNHLIKIIIKPDELTAAEYDFIKSHEYKKHTYKYRWHNYDIYKHISFTDSSEILIKLSLK